MTLFENRFGGGYLFIILDRMEEIYNVTRNVQATLGDQHQLLHTFTSRLGESA